MEPISWKELFATIVPWLIGILSAGFALLVTALVYIFKGMADGVKELGTELREESRNLRDNIADLTSEVSSLVKDISVVATRSNEDHEEIKKLRKETHSHANELAILKSFHERHCDVYKGSPITKTVSE